MANQFLVKETMAAMRNLSASEIDGLKGNNPVYAGVQLLGYYEKGDTPAPIIYHYVDLQNEPDPGTDDGGSIIEIGNNKLRHDFKGADIYDIYFGYKTGVFFTKEQNNLKLNSMYNSDANSIVHSPGVEADISESLIIDNENLKIEGNGFVIRQADNSSLITYTDRPLIDIISNGVMIEDLVLDDNIQNNFVMLGANKIHAANPGDIPGVTRTGHDVLVIRANNVVVRRVVVEGASWTGIKVTYDPNNVEVNNVIIEDCVVNQTFRDSISIMHCRNVKVRNNKINNGIHHQIHVYTNTLNTEVSGNHCFNNLTDIFHWYTGINLENYERGCIIVDHVSYDKKTVNTVISNNIVISNSLSDFKAGVVTQGYPENVSIKNNLFIRCTRGLFIARGNPVGDICTITGNTILGSVNGVHFWPAASGGNYGGKTTPQQSRTVLSANNIESSDIAIRVSGSVENVQNFYSLYNVLLEGNTINGKPDLTLSQELNFSGNALGTHKIILDLQIKSAVLVKQLF
ncbi:right-handed parallel beta-helix repeat-containing protein [Sphingobacterium sp. DR205]|uniref:right-handed parallel beta-helix repeat-containing protein n=1 Tax=Sphingobacterium sp. DR205 TaxID=2713573 RepID=UPI0013E4AB83|nr:right-handed parallel beta-helix repeat-containing protein [Sphingobacterium sp. DR205]QIH34805.1 hypothetical protein G6053_18735 [Sphingobacterium sp. DR205]